MGKQDEQHEVALVIPAEAQRGRVEVGALIEMAKVLDISSDAEAEKANEYRRQALALEKQIERAFDPICDAAHKAWKKATMTRAEFLEPVATAKRLITDKLAKWTNAQRAEAERVAREETVRRQAEAEAAKLREVEALKEAGEAEQAAVVESEPVAIAPVEAAAPAVKLAGFSTREDWDFRVLDKSKLQMQFLVPDERAIRAIVKAMKQDAHQVLGVGAVSIFKVDTGVNRG